MNLYEQELHFWASKGSPISMLSGKTVMLSGATGAIGRCLIDLFMMYNEAAENTALRRKTDLPKSPIQVIALSRNADTAKKRLAVYRDRDTFRYIPCDVNQMIPECGSADYIIHAASNTHPLLYSTDSIGTIASNVIGTKNLLDYAAAHHTEHFCFLSSVEIYGENRGDTEKFDETYLGYLDSNTLRAGYPESKRLGEALCNAYRQTYGIAFDIPRLSRVYGPTMLSSDTKALSQFL